MSSLVEAISTYISLHLNRVDFNSLEANPLMLNVHFVHKAPLMCGPKVEPIRSHSHVSEENTLSVLERIVSYRGDIFKLPSDNDPAADALLTAEQL